MTSTALTTPSADPTPDLAQSTFLRAVWARLTMCALFAAITSSLIAWFPPLRAMLILEQGASAIGLTLAGVAAAASAFLVWAPARLLARGPNLLNPVWLWLFSIAVGASATTLAILFLRSAPVSVFVMTAVGLGAVQLAHRLDRQLPSLASALIFAVTAGAFSWLGAFVFTSTWTGRMLDAAAVAIIFSLIVLRADALPRLRRSLKRPDARSAATYAAMHVIGLAHAKGAAERPPQNTTEEASS